MLSAQLRSPSLLYLLFCHLLLLFLLVLLPCNSHWHTHLSAWLLLVLTSPCLGPYTSSHSIQSQDYPSVDLLANLSLIAKCPESKGAFGCSPLFPSPLSPLTNRFFSMIKQVLKVQLLHWQFRKTLLIYEEHSPHEASLFHCNGPAFMYMANLESQCLENYNESKAVNVIFIATVCYTQVPRDFLGTFVSFTNSNIWVKVCKLTQEGFE